MGWRGDLVMKRAWERLKLGFVVGFLRAKAKARLARGNRFANDVDALHRASEILEQEKTAYN